MLQLPFVTDDANPVDPLSGLRRLALIRSLRGVPLHCVMSLRFCAMCEAARYDPLADLAVHFGNLEAAGAMLALRDGVTQLWPDKFEVCRPCCPCLTPDEATLVAMVVHALAGDRDGFASVLDGYVRAGRQEWLYDLSVRAAVALHGTAQVHQA